jgi:hypothetical protein
MVRVAVREQKGDHRALSWRMNTKGPAFLRLRARLADTLLPPDQTSRMKHRRTP